MIILAFLQNQWFKDPDRVRQMYEENPEYRQRYIASFLFMGCLTGKRLETAFGEELCQEIIWEEASPNIAGYSSAVFPADQVHIKETILKFRPNVVLTFGKVATDGVWQALVPNAFQCLFIGQDKNEYDIKETTGETIISFKLIIGPHPASRKDPMPRLREMAEQVRMMQSEVLELE